MKNNDEPSSYLDLDKAKDNQKGATNKRKFQNLSFRSVSDSLDKKVKINEGNFYLTEDIDTNDVEFRAKSWQARFKRSTKRFIFKFFLLKFLYDFLVYVYTRLRVLIVYLAISVELISNQIELLKKFIIRKIFWGRGNVFKFTVQLIGGFVLVIVMIASVYRSQFDDISYKIFDQESYASTAYASDLFVQNSSTRTVVNRDVERLESEKYVVKGGDTISQIADEFEINSDTLLWANELAADEVVQPGDELVIPPGNGVVVEVEEGDTVETLAEEYETSPQLIVEWNWIDAGGSYALTEGDSIFLPDGELPLSQRQPTIASTQAGSNRQSLSISNVISAGGTSSAPISNTNPNDGVGKFLGWPVAAGDGILTQCFSGFHNGVDIADRSKPAIVAAAPGKVTFAGCQSGSCPAPGYETGGVGLAWSVVVDHGNGFSTVYAHLNEIYVSSGQQVETGTVLGQMGQSGLAYGIHIHFMLIGTKSGIRPGNYYNPAAYMKAGICGY